MSSNAFVDIACLCKNTNRINRIVYEGSKIILIGIIKHTFVLLEADTS
ncbi:hypothetical protein [Treponema pedis]|nr:hypothetical protein [Treponema pedis]